MSRQETLVVISELGGYPTKQPDPALVCGAAPDSSTRVCRGMPHPSPIGREKVQVALQPCMPCMFFAPRGCHAQFSAGYLNDSLQDHFYATCLFPCIEWAITRDNTFSARDAVLLAGDMWYMAFRRILHDIMEEMGFAEVRTCLCLFVLGGFYHMIVLIPLITHASTVDS